ncbi:tRNA synthase complex-interacting multifunctional protein 1 [mine drainage metagenome]|uniref:tRNA synthase complex-interacting multifunctional protein 1 n=1 Tax=mine drainage metagenome TaxID=410659 RepID=T1AXR5_9ZZZZ
MFPRAGRTARLDPTSTPTRASAPVLAIRAGTVRSVAPHPDADRLYVLGVDLGEETLRTIVAGMRAHYAPEELEGRRITVLANLAPRTIRRVTSQGMVLAAEAGETVVLLAPPEGVPPGTIIDGATADAPVITIEELAKTPLVVGRVEGSENETTSRIDIGGRRIEAEGTWPRGSMVIVRLAAPGADRGTVLSFRPEGPIRPSAEMPVGAKIR